MEWQPIETAPKDEVRVLLTDGREVAVGEYFLSEWSNESEIEFSYGDCFHGTWAPTHWMPLPAAPEPRDA